MSTVYPVPVADLGPGDLHPAGTVTGKRTTRSGKSVYVTFRQPNGSTQEIKFGAGTRTYVHAQAITAGMLRQLLADVADDTVIVMSRDSEGNGFSAAWHAGLDEWVPGEYDQFTASPDAPRVKALYLTPMI